MNQGSRSITPEQSQLIIASGAITSPRKRKPQFMLRRSKILIAFILLLVWLAGVMIYQTHKPLPPGFPRRVLRIRWRMWPSGTT